MVSAQCFLDFARWRSFQIDDGPVVSIGLMLNPGGVYHQQILAHRMNDKGGRSGPISRGSPPLTGRYV
ncbi:hypothetical protein EPA93_42920 [Ktedonosporobacter rubrisoli]|uniref:Uncharacterized protein n=1 Tax=Ktedonosporobacter rubrisoli TaxID=2509675 RepID=A0A4V0Z088_KTERU|nr:hypothetical protein [Ktedonosporobacter rubrisoli]QBD82371.1 hypothetical protein EPA93_42920 [Ktedonosporobacter rubrisoli]